jgi:predicted PurR-regulated permease PerM
MAKKPSTAAAPGELRAWALKVLIALALVAAALVVFRWLHVLLLAFGAALVAVMLRAVADPIRRHTPLDAAWSVGAAVLAVVLIVAAVFYVVGEQVGLQLALLREDLPSAWAAAQAQIAGLQGGDWILQELRHRASDLPKDGLAPIAGYIGRWTRGGVEALAQGVMVLVAGVYFAAQPRLYRHGLLRLLPDAAQPRAGAIADEAVVALKKWLLGTGAAMLAMGVLTAIGTAILGLPAPMALGLLSGLAEFVPIVGAAVSAIPGLLLAVPQGPEQVIWTLLFYVAVHQLEGHVLIPLIQRKVVAAPPALTLFAVLGFGVLFGPLGVIVATPLAVVAMVVVNQLHPAENAAGEAATHPVGARGEI